MDNFRSIETIKYVGNKNSNPFAYHYYDPKKIILGKTMEDHLRFAVSYWHTYCWKEDIIEFASPKTTDILQIGKQHIDKAFDFISTLGLKFFTFLDRDLIPASNSLKEDYYYLNLISDLLKQAMNDTNIKLLWGASNLLSSSKYHEGAATSHDPYVFSYAVTQVKLALDITHKLHGENYVIWNRCEGYETLLNTNLDQELNQLGRFLSMLVDYKNKIGFKGNLLIEPSSTSNSKKYDYDTLTIFALLQKFNLEKEFKVNIEANFLNLSSHALPYEVAFALTNNIFGSIDANQSNPKQPWDTNLVSEHLSEIVQIIYLILHHGGFTTGGLNFDNKMRRKNINLNELFQGHIKTIDLFAKALEIAVNLCETKQIERILQTRYSNWNSSLGKSILLGKTNFEEIAKNLLNNEIQPIVIK